VAKLRHSVTSGGGYFIFAWVRFLKVLGPPKLLRQFHNVSVKLGKLFFGCYLVVMYAFTNNLAHFFVKKTLVGHVNFKLVAEFIDEQVAELILFI
jgi:hypothetical protein